MKNIISLLILLLLSTPLFAFDSCDNRDLFGDCIDQQLTNDEYKDELGGIITSFNNSLENSNAGIIADQNDTKWFLNLIRLRFRAFAVYQVPLLAKIKVIPHLEFFWRRTPPQGWKPYQP